MKYLQDVSGKKLAKYMVLPGIIPRLRDFATTGFSELAFLMALIYGAVRLLPAEHPYLNPANKGRFGIRNVIAVAASRLVFKWENADQILIFAALLISFVLLVLQFAYLIISFLIHPAMAQSIPGIGDVGSMINNLPFLGGGTPTASGMFDTAAPNQDVAFMLLDSVFGIPGFFGSCVDTTVGGNPCTAGTPGVFPTPFHLGLQAMFQFYSLAMLLIGVLIFVYYVFVVVGETAITGTPFGKRFDHIWAPIRLVVALGLLVPVSHGLNSAQYIVLYAAKIGSGFATNAWTMYNQDLDSPLGLAATAPEQNSSNPNPPSVSTTNALIARPTAPEIYPLMQFMTLVQACRAGYESQYRNIGGNDQSDVLNGMKIRPFLVDGQNRELADGLAWADALKFYNNHDIVIRFGDDGDYDNADSEFGNDVIPGNDVYASETGGVAPLCGEITIHTSDLSGVSGDVGNTGTAIAQEGYYNMILQMFDDQDLINFGTRAACLHLKPLPADGQEDERGNCTAPDLGDGDDLEKMPSDSWKQNEAKLYQSELVTTLDQAYRSVLQNTDFTVTNDIISRGWGGAGIWYTKLAQWNGALQDADTMVPTASRMPQVMEQIESQKSGHDNTLDVSNKYTPSQSGGEAPTFTQAADADIGVMLSDVYQYWQAAPTAQTDLISHGNIVVDAINWIFGSSGIFDLRQNDSIHPLAQLVALGKGIMNATMRNLLISMGFAAGGGFATGMKWAIMAGLASMGQQLFSTFAIIGITIGFVLYYVLPFMPFIYFYFAVGAWVKAIFEAMVGVPLWALAHLKIEGQGLPAQSAMTGYLLIFEIFLRPILTVFGLLASIGVLSALVRSLNSIFSLVTSNVTGFDCGANCVYDVGLGVADITIKRDAYDAFFFTVMYTIIVYLMAVSCFKLIDQIPGSVMRWMGSSVPTFEDGVGDPIAKLSERASVGTQLVSEQVIPALNTGASLGGQLGGSLTNALISRNKK